MFAADSRTRRPGPDVDAEAEPSALEAEKRESSVDAAAHAQRLDKVLVPLAPEFSRSHLQDLIVQGHVMLDDVVVTVASRKVRVGQRLRVTL
jgi:23S rRNA pseudouridine1911/1915/1917 synthase